MVVTDPGTGVAGRGAYVCPEAACLDRALTGGRLARAFRKPCVPSPDLAPAVRAASRRDEGGAGRDPAAGSDVREVGVMAVRA
jgi:predicted RNA-binding protein YlxR (DUF448 family)